MRTVTGRGSQDSDKNEDLLQLHPERFRVNKRTEVSSLICLIQISIAVERTLQFLRVK